MYKTKKFGVVSCKAENQILAELERDISRERRNKHKQAGNAVTVPVVEAIGKKLAENEAKNATS